MITRDGDVSKKSKPVEKSTGPVESKVVINKPPELIANREQSSRRSAPINSVEHQKFVLASSGDYTPEAIREIYNTPIMKDVASASTPEYAPQYINGKLTPAINLPVGYFGNGFSPVGARTALSHEYGHHFDFSNNIVDSNPDIESRLASSALPKLIDY